MRQLRHLAAHAASIGANMPASEMQTISHDASLTVSNGHLVYNPTATDPTGVTASVNTSAQTSSTSAPLSPSTTLKLNDAIVGPNFNVSQTNQPEAETIVKVNPTDPLNIAISTTADSFFTDDPGAVSHLVWVTQDGGAHWKPIGALPIDAAFDVSLSFDAYGNLFVATLTDDNATQTIRPDIFESSDKGNTFTNLGFVGPTSFVDSKNNFHFILDDYPQLATGASGLGNGTQAFWVATTIFDDFAGTAIPEATGTLVTGLGSNHIGVGGNYFPYASQFVNLPAPNSFGESAVIGVGPDGQLLEAYLFDRLKGNTDLVGIASNLDPDGLGSKTFGSGNIVLSNANANIAGYNSLIPGFNVDQIAPPADPLRGEFIPHPMVAWDLSNGPNHGRAYITYMDLTNATTTALTNYDTSIFVTYSDSNGSTWSAPHQVNDVTGSTRLFPGIAVDPSSGKVALTWYDARNDLGNYGYGDTDGVPNTDVALYGALSLDGTSTFLPNFQISKGFTNGFSADFIYASRAIPGSFAMGDYTQIDFRNGTLYTAWMDNSVALGNNPGNEGDIAFSAIKVPNVLTAVNESYNVLAAANSTISVDASHGVLSQVADPSNQTVTLGTNIKANLVTGPAHGTLHLNPDGSFTYQPAAGFIGTDSFTYFASKGSQNTNTATVSLVVDRNTPTLAFQGSKTLNYTQEGQPIALNNVTLAGILSSNSGNGGSKLPANLDGSILTILPSQMDYNNSIDFIQNGSFQASNNTITISGRVVAHYQSFLNFATTSGIGDGPTFPAQRPLTIVFATGVSISDVNTVLANITYQNLSSSYTALSDRTLKIQFTDGAGAKSNVLLDNIHMVQPNTKDNPQIQGPSSVNIAVQDIQNLGVDFNFGTDANIQITDPGVNSNTLLRVELHFGTGFVENFFSDLLHTGVRWAFKTDDTYVIIGSIKDINSTLNTLLLAQYQISTGTSDTMTINVYSNLSAQGYTTFDPNNPNFTNDVLSNTGTLAATKTITLNFTPASTASVATASLNPTGGNYFDIPGKEDFLTDSIILA